MPLTRSMMPRRADFGAMVRLALPVAAVQMGMVFMGVVDTIMVGRVSGEELAAVALGNLYFFACSIFGMGVLFALDPVISQAYGADDDEGVRRGVQRGWVLAAGLTVVASLLLAPALPVMHLLRQPAEVVPIAAGYAVVSIPGLLPFYGFVVLRQSLQAMGLVRPIVTVIVVSNLVNAGLNWLFIFGNGGFPAMGAVGSSWATVLSRWFMLGMLLWVGWSVLGRYHRPFRREALERAPLLRTLRVGAPIGVQFFLEFGIFGLIGVLMGLLGTTPMAAHQIAINLASLTFMAAVGVAQAATVLVGQAVGAGDPDRARRAAGAGVVLGGGVMVVTAVLFWIAPEPLAALYTNQPEVMAVAITLIPVAAFFQVFDGLQVASAGILRGVGDTFGPMLVNVLGFWLIGLPVSVWLGFRTPLGPTGLWWGLVVGLGAVSIFLLIRVRTHMGRDLQRMEIEDVAA